MTLISLYIILFSLLILYLRNGFLIHLILNTNSSVAEALRVCALDSECLLYHLLWDLRK